MCLAQVMEKEPANAEARWQSARIHIALEQWDEAEVRLSSRPRPGWSSHFQ